MESGAGRLNESVRPRAAAAPVGSSQYLDLCSDVPAQRPVLLGRGRRGVSASVGMRGPVCFAPLQLPAGNNGPLFASPCAALCPRLADDAGSSRPKRSSEGCGGCGVWGAGVSV